MYDAVYLFAKALHDLDASQQIDINPISCDSAADTFSHGFSLINYMKVVCISFYLVNTFEVVTNKFNESSKCTPNSNPKYFSNLIF